MAFIQCRTNLQIKTIQLRSLATTNHFSATVQFNVVASELPSTKAEKFHLQKQNKQNSIF